MVAVVNSCQLKLAFKAGMTASVDDVQGTIVLAVHGQEHRTAEGHHNGALVGCMGI